MLFCKGPPPPPCMCLAHPNTRSRHAVASGLCNVLTERAKQEVQTGMLSFTVSLYHRPRRTATLGTRMIRHVASVRTRWVVLGKYASHNRLHTPHPKIITLPQLPHDLICFKHFITGLIFVPDPVYQNCVTAIVRRELNLLNH